MSPTEPAVVLVGEKCWWPDVSTVKNNPTSAKWTHVPHSTNLTSFQLHLQQILSVTWCTTDPPLDPPDVEYRGTVFNLSLQPAFSLASEQRQVGLWWRRSYRVVTDVGCPPVCAHCVTLWCIGACHHLPTLPGSPVIFDMSRWIIDQ